MTQTEKTFKERIMKNYIIGICTEFNGKMNQRFEETSSKAEMEKRLNYYKSSPIVTNISVILEMGV